MSVLAAVNKACVEALALKPFEALFEASQETRDVLELRAIVNAAATYIARDYDWPALKKLGTITGDGTTEAFAVPSDYDRMVVKTGLWSSTRRAPLRAVIEEDVWLSMLVTTMQSPYGSWMLYADQIAIRPTLGSDETVTYFYVSSQCVRAADSTYKTEFTLDTDTFRLDETLLKLGVIWQYKAAKGLAYAEDMATYEREKEKLVTRAKGSRIIRVGNVRMPAGAEIAYPFNVDA